MDKKIRIVIADDHPIFRSGLSQLFASDAAFEIVGEAENGSKALSLIRQTAPDVAVLDIDIPEKDGFQVVRELSAEHKPAGVIFLTMHNNEAIFNAALDLGARGFVLKDSAMEDIVEAVKTVFRGDSFISPPLSKFLLKRAGLGTISTPIDGLTPSERRILKLVGELRSSREIAEILFISIRTVERHRENMTAKLGLHGNKALLKFALDNKDLIGR